MLALMAALAIQAEPPDAAAVAVDTIDECQIVVRAAFAGYLPSVAVTSDGHQARLTRRTNDCGMTISDWQGSPAVAEAVRVRLEGWTVDRWREAMVNERGPTLWSEFSGDGLWVRLIEPVDGRSGELSLQLGEE